MEINRKVAFYYKKTMGGSYYNIREVLLHPSEIEPVSSREDDSDDPDIPVNTLGGSSSGSAQQDLDKKRRTTRDHLYRTAMGFRSFSSLITTRMTVLSYFYSQEPDDELLIVSENPCTEPSAQTATTQQQAKSRLRIQ